MATPPTFQLRLNPMGKVIPVAAGSPLPEVLFAHGVEFPCGARGACRGCRVRVTEGALEPTVHDRKRFTESELQEGWRLSCQARMDGDLTLELAQWESSILGDETAVPVQSRPGLGIVIDLGTTTLVAQCINLRDGRVLAVESALNPQAVHGADLMSRLEFAVRDNGAGKTVLRDKIRARLGKMVERLLANAQDTATVEPVAEVLIAGNTAMHHFFCGIDPAPLTRYPFEPPDLGEKQFSSRDLGWELPGEPSVRFLPCLGSFVGSDILAGILAAGLHQSEDIQALIDLGTNGEIVVAASGQLLCASTAAGPAFEGARIRMGMRAATGAIARVQRRGRGLHCEILGGTPPRGLCGSGLVDAVAAGLDLNWIDASGRIHEGRDSLLLQEPVRLDQGDIRELQLAKGAIAAGLVILLKQCGHSPEQLRRLYLAGAFGNYISQPSATRIGLLPVQPEQISPIGNSALIGLKKLLLDPETQEEVDRILREVRHLSLSTHPDFQDIYVENMRFPA